MEGSDMKTLRGWQATLDRQLKEAKALLEQQSLEIKDLSLSKSNFVGVIETLIQKMNLSTGGQLQELTIDGLNKDLLFRDSNLADRFGRGALQLRKLFIGNVR